MNTDQEWDAFLRDEIDRFLSEFQGMETVVAQDTGEPSVVRVHSPYMMQTVTLVDREQAFARLKPRHQQRLIRVKEARENAPAAVKAFLHEQFYGSDGGEKPVAQGRADAKEIQRFLQAAVDRGLVPVVAGSHDLRAWLKRYGIGLDCSAFVQHALTRLVRASHAAVGEAPDERDGSGLGFVRSGWVYRDVTESAARDLFAHIPAPGAARPGDVLVKLGHLRMVADIERAPAGAVILHLVESISASGIPSGQATTEVDIGPRRLQVKYPEPDRPIGEQTPLHRAWGSDAFEADKVESLYVLGRLRALNPYRVQFHIARGKGLHPAIG
jgi:hypothetical protein